MSVLLKIKSKWRTIRNQYKSLKFHAFKLRYDNKKSSYVLERKDISNILIYRWDDKLGDTIMSGLLIKILNKYRPDIKISVICGKTSKLWLEKIVKVDKYIFIDKRKYKKFNFNSINKYDVFIDMSTGFSYKDLYLASKLDVKYYISGSDNTYNLIDCYLNNESHFYQRYISASEYILDRKLESNDLIIPYPDFIKEEEFYKENISFSGNVIAINLFGSGKYRRFSFIEAKKLLSRWLETHTDDLIILIPVPGESEFLIKLTNTINNTRLRYFDVNVNFENVLAIINFADFVFTPDTAIIHMASALNKATIGIYRYDVKNLSEWKPLAQNSYVIFNRKPYFDNDSVYVHEFEWDELELTRSKILKAIK
ncbi:TPA: glycosyltransferase family 9 protein [Photobacterium damselae]